MGSFRRVLKTRRYKQPFHFPQSVETSLAVLRITCGGIHENTIANDCAVPRCAGRGGPGPGQTGPGQTGPVTAENPLSTWNKIAYARVKGILPKSAGKMRGRQLQL